MPLVPAQQLLMDAKKRGYCLAGFDVFNPANVAPLVGYLASERAAQISGASPGSSRTSLI